MDKESRYIAYAKERFARLKGRGIILTGATGGIGKGAARLLGALGCRLLFLVRNLKAGEALAKELEEQFGVEAKAFPYDALDEKAVDSVLAFLAKEPPYDCFLSIAGIYHQPAKDIDGIERTFRVNSLAPLKLLKGLAAAYPQMEAVQTLSLVCRYKPRYRADDVSDATSFRAYLSSIASRNARYALSKRFLMQALIVERRKGLKIALAHPGVAYTNLFDPKNKAYPRAFYRMAPPLMKAIFMPAEKAALSILEAADKGSEEGKIVGPRGLFHAWGYPKEYSYPSSIHEGEEWIAVLLEELSAQ